MANSGEQAPERGPSRCVTCRAPLPLREPRAGEQARVWICAACQTTHRGVLADDADADLRSAVALAPASASAKSSAIIADLGIRHEAFRPRGTSREALPPRAGIRAPVETTLSRELDWVIERGATDTVPEPSPALRDRIRRPEAVPYDPHQVEQVVRLYEQGLERAQSLSDALISGTAQDLSAADEIVGGCLKSLDADVDLGTCIGANPVSGDYPTRHSLHVTTVAVSMAANLGYEREAQRSLGLGCLLHDLGMHTLTDVRVADEEVFSTRDFVPIAAHPIQTVEMLGPLFDRISLEARLVTYQTHERSDGSGYPRGRGGDLIHPLARVAAVADAFVALVSTRPHRPGLMPYYAMENILRAAGDGKFDAAACRALLDSVSLFPLGSFVELDDGRPGRVVRAHLGRHDRPVLEVWPVGGREKPPQIVDLAEETDLRVARALAGLPAA